MKKLKIILTFLSILLLVSCKNANINTETTIKEDTISDLKLILTYDSTVKNELGDTILKDNVNPDLTIKSSYNNELNMYMEELILTKDDIYDLLLNSKLKDYLSVGANKSSHLFKNIYTFDIKFLSSLQSLVDNNLSTYLKYVHFNNKFIVPGKIISSNSNNVINENTLEWTYTLDQINGNTNILFEYETYSILRISLFVLAILALTIGVIYITKNRNKTNSID